MALSANYPTFAQASLPALWLITVFRATTRDLPDCETHSKKSKSIHSPRPVGAWDVEIEIVWNIWYVEFQCPLQCLTFCSGENKDWGYSTSYEWLCNCVQFMKSKKKIIEKRCRFYVLGFNDPDAISLKKMRFTHTAQQIFSANWRMHTEQAKYFLQHLVFDWLMIGWLVAEKGTRSTDINTCNCDRLSLSLIISPDIRLTASRYLSSSCNEIKFNVSQIRCSNSLRPKRCVKSAV